MKTNATERIEKLVPGIVQLTPNNGAYELIADRLEAQNEALKLAELRISELEEKLK